MYPGRLLLLGVLGASVVRTAPPTPAPIQEHVETVQHRVVRGEAPPVPGARVLRFGGPATVLTFNQKVIGLRVVQGQTPDLPEASVRRDDLGHTGAEPVVGANPFLRGRLVSGTSPDTPKSRVERFGGPAPVVTFNQNANFRVVRGEPPKAPEGSTRRDTLGHTGADEPTTDFLRSRLVSGTPPPVPESRSVRFGGPATVVTFNQHVAPRVVQGEAPPAPESSIRRDYTSHADTVTFNQNVEPRVVRGEDPPTPEGRVERIPTQRPEIADHRLEKLHRVVVGQAPVPDARSERWQVEHTGAEPPVPADIVWLGLRIVRGDEPEAVGARVVRYGGPATVVTFNQNVAPRVVAGEAPPAPEASVNRIPTQRPAIADHRVKEQHRVVAGEAPVPDARATRWQVEHTGAEPVLPALAPRGRSVRGDDPPIPGSRVERFGGPSVIAPFNRNVAPRITRGEDPPVPDSRVERIPTQRAAIADHKLERHHRVVVGQAPTPEARVERIPVQRAAIADHKIEVQHRLVVGEAPTPDSRAARWGLWHTGAVPPAIEVWTACDPVPTTGWTGPSPPATTWTPPIDPSTVWTSCT